MNLVENKVGVGTRVLGLLERTSKCISNRRLYRGFKISEATI